ncbi:hypothetical protein Ngar_c29550 [Candidatus Nitrososphaera gargensis Ga9.2]|uniref:Uncharacterized protein n=1 Tax=Nitrososphaera gargensis (strain Ga9.2) TaxID=1237085 RepID=K0IKN8_NITGG|nr:hypothetical protein [Candidatus Nitrososphaera gargensis]AFU59873.1 hypothetical protein Ngar_c29550 [Candidatus Nitrososphaera gargensis Ga9.2]
MVYRNSIDAFQQLLLSPAVSQISAKSGHMQNGISYCVVQVSFANGDEYRIEAFDEEADELYRVAREQSSLLCLHANA